MRIRHLIAVLLVLGLGTVGAMAANWTVSPDGTSHSTGYTTYDVKTDGTVLAYGGAVIGTTRQGHGYLKFDTSLINDAVVPTAVEFHFYVNATNWPYFSVTPVSTDPNGFGSSADVLWDDIIAEAAPTAAWYAFRNEGSTYATGWKTLYLHDSAEVDLQAGLAADWFALGIASRDDDAQYYLTVDGHSDTNVPYLVVYDDPPPANDTCAAAVVIPGSIGAYNYTGDTFFAANDYEPNAACVPGGHTGPDVAYQITLPANCEICVTLNQNVMTWNGAVYMVTDCSDVGGTCVAGASGWLPGGLDENFCYTDTATDTYYIIVDGRDGGGAGAYTLDVTVSCLTAPSGLTCVDNDTSIDLSWTNTDTYDNVEVYEDGVLVDTLGGTATSYNYVPGKGYHCYYVCGTTTLDSKCSTECCLIYGYDNHDVLWDFEADDGGFVVDGTGFWEWGELTYGACATPGNNVWGTDLDADYVNLACWTLDSGLIDLGDKGSFVCIDHCYDTEAGFDGGVVWFTTDDFWYYNMPPLGGGTSSFLGNISCPFANNQFGFNGVSGGWVTDCWDLTGTDWIGEMVKMRYVFASDGSVVSGSGWHIDNVTVYNNGSGTFSCDYTITPSVGTLPFTVTQRVTLTNLLVGPQTLTRRIAAQINLITGNGTSFSNWRSGSSQILPGASFVTAFNLPLPAVLAAVGNNQFTMLTEDITPAPYNQPPNPPSGDQCTVVNVVVGNAP